ALAQQIKAHPEFAEVVLLMLSSAGRPEDPARCSKLGISTYLTKPIKQSELLDAILAARQVAASEAAPLSPIAPQGDGRHLRILLAEDNLVNQRLAMRILEKHGHQVVLANNGLEALAA